MMLCKYLQKRFLSEPLKPIISSQELLKQRWWMARHLILWHIFTRVYISFLSIKLLSYWFRIKISVQISRKPILTHILTLLRWYIVRKDVLELVQYYSLLQYANTLQKKCVWAVYFEKKMDFCKFLISRCNCKSILEFLVSK